MPEAVLARTFRALSPGQKLTFASHFPFWAHPGQGEPDGDWRVWLMMAGRGFGKTRAGAEWLSARARETPNGRLAMIGATIHDVVSIMVKGQSGLLAVAAEDAVPVWRPARGELAWPNGAIAYAFSGHNPDRLRGPEHHFAWCDELAKWRLGQECWDNLMLGLRLGAAPRTMVTTTPRPIESLKAIVGQERTQVTHGRTVDNPFLSEDFRAMMVRLYGGTRLGRQELDGVLFDDVAGALWTRELIEASRVAAAPSALLRIVIGVDPPASAEGDACGIIACGLGADGIGYVLGDHSAGGLSPAGWAARVAGAAEAWGAQRIVAEANMGGAMVEAVLRSADRRLPLRLVHASDHKAARAEPIAAMFESGHARLAGRFPELEDELCGLVAGGSYAGPGRSPDRADAMVWAMTELMLGRREARPRVMLP